MEAVIIVWTALKQLRLYRCILVSIANSLVYFFHMKSFLQLTFKNTDTHPESSSNIYKILVVISFCLGFSLMIPGVVGRLVQQKSSGAKVITSEILQHFGLLRIFKNIILNVFLGTDANNGIKKMASMGCKMVGLSNFFWPGSNHYSNFSTCAIDQYIFNTEVYIIGMDFIIPDFRIVGRAFLPVLLEFFLLKL